MKLWSCLVVALAVLAIGGVAEAGPINVALNKTVTANVSYGPEPLANAVDGNTNTQAGRGAHASSTNPWWLQVDLGQVYSIDKFVLTSADTGVGGWYGYTTIYNLYYLAGGGWTLVGSDTFNDGYDTEHEYAPVGGVSSRYVLYEVVGGQHWAHIREIEVYADTGVAVVPLPSAAFLGLGLLGALGLARRIKRRRI